MSLSALAGKSSNSAVGFAAMKDAADFDSVRIKDKEKPVVSNAEPEFVPRLKRFYVALACFRKSVQSGKDAHRSRLVETANISLGRVGPDDSLHRAL
jgi:hypothetical protein